jgi:hypothetical protein
MKLEITLRGQVEAGEHTVYTRIIEEGVEIDDARYFDLPVKVVIQEEVIPNRLEITDKTEKSRFAPGEEKNLEYRISNQNNIPLDVVIRLDQPAGWEGAIRATSSQLGSDFLIINLPAYSSKDFSVTMVAPEDLKDSEQAQFEFRVTPMDNETPFPDDYVQKFTFSYMTECSGATCLFRELVNPEPQTIAFYVVILALLFYARGRSGRQGDVFYEDDMEAFEKELEPLDEEDDLPAPVLAAEDDDDDLELLEELEDL